jgi:hypothetical protein
MPYGYKELKEDLVKAKESFRTLNFGEEAEIRNLSEGRESASVNERGNT